MTSDLGDKKEVCEELTQTVKPATQALNPDADIFYSKDGVITEELLSDVDTEDHNCTLADEILPQELCPQGESLFPKDGSKSEIAGDDCSSNEQDLSMAMNGTASVELPLDLLSLSQDQTQSDAANIQSDEIHSSDGTIPLPQLKALLQQQLEYYFSRENLANDTYLLSQMDSDQYVPIGTVANFNQIKCLTKDLNLIVDVLRESPNVQVDDAGEKVRPSHKRCVLILREIPDTTPVKDIESLFNSENCPKFVSCEFAHNSSWYVTFESDEDAQQAYCYLREEVKTFQGKPIMARIKAKSITRASFIQPSKNGLRQPVESSMYVNQSHQQPQPRYSYGNVPTVTYSNQQVFPPFYPPAMLHSWTPTAPACFDLGTVFSLNGLAPQPTFKPVGSNGRHNFHMVRGRGSKPYNRMHQTFDQDQSNRIYDRGQSMPYVHRQQHTMLNGTTAGIAYLPYPFSSRNPYAFGLDVHDIFTSSTPYSKRQDTHSSNYTHASHSQSQTSNQSRTVTKEVVVNVNHSTQQQESRLAADPGKELAGQPQRNRSRRKKKEDISKLSDTNGTSLDSGDKSPSAKQDCPKFDLEASSFPPLPGSLEAEGYDNEIFESRLSDVVKGTVKPSMKDSKTQTSESSLSNSNVTMKDSSTLTNGDLAPVVLTPPSSPEIVENFISLQEEVAEDSFPENREESSGTVSPIPVISTVSTASPPSPVSRPNCAVITTCSSSPPPSTPVISLQEVLPPAKVAVGKTNMNKPHEIEEPHFAINGHLESDSPPNVEDDKPTRKLTYSEVAQRAKERVEKLAQELKEKERQEAVARLRQQEAQSRQPAFRGSFREFSKGRFSDQRSRLRDFRNRRTGFVNSADAARHPDRSNREEFREDGLSTDVKPIK